MADRCMALTWAFVAGGAVVTRIHASGTCIFLKTLEHLAALGGNAVEPLLKVKRLKSNPR